MSLKEKLYVCILEIKVSCRYLDAKKNLSFSCQTGFYRFCCEGVYCPGCPLELSISTLGQNISVNSALSLSCVNTSFRATFNTNSQPGIFAIKVSCFQMLVR